MISKLLFAFEKSVVYIKENPQIKLALMLVIILPLAFLYSGNAFLEAGRANQDKLQRDRIGLLHDSFASLLEATDFDVNLAQNQIIKITNQNPDLTKFKIVEQVGRDFVVIASADTTEIGVFETEIDIYQVAAVRFDESIIIPFSTDTERLWQSVRSIADNRTNYFILTENSFISVDNYLSKREQEAYYILVLVYLLVLLIAYWHIRTTDYKHLYKEAQRAIKTKDLFTNMIAHELRAPLTAIRGYASMLEDTNQITGEQKDYPRRIHLSAERLIEVVNDLLDVARIQSGKLKISKSQILLSEVVEAVIAELNSSATEKGLELKSEVDASLSLEVDPKRLQQILTNIISNSIKYTKTGSITIVSTQKRFKTEIRIQDTGMGINAEDQQHLFAPFYRVENEDVSKITGTGLGMWITRQFVELMGGKISVESIKGVGTHVVLVFEKH
jgi:signal transduction histidine kinase